MYADAADAAAAAAAAEFQYPGDWLADRNMYARRAQRIERRNSLDPMAPSRCSPSLLCVLLTLMTCTLLTGIGQSHARQSLQHDLVRVGSILQSLWHALIYSFVTMPLFIVSLPSQCTSAENISHQPNSCSLRCAPQHYEASVVMRHQTAALLM